MAKHADPNGAATAKTDRVSPAESTVEVLKELDSYRDTIRAAFEEGYSFGCVESNLAKSWERSQARQDEAAFAYTRMSVGAVVDMRSSLVGERDMFMRSSYVNHCKAFDANSLLQRLRDGGYVQHLPGCFHDAMGLSGNIIVTPACTCGLAALLEKL